MKGLFKEFFEDLKDFIKDAAELLAVTVAIALLALAIWLNLQHWRGLI